MGKAKQSTVHQIGCISNIDRKQASSESEASSRAVAQLNGLTGLTGLRENELSWRRVHYYKQLNRQRVQKKLAKHESLAKYEKHEIA